MEDDSCFENEHAELVSLPAGQRVTVSSDDSYVLDALVSAAIGAILRRSHVGQPLGEEACGQKVDEERDEDARHGDGRRRGLVLELADAVLAEEQLGVRQELFGAWLA